MKTISLIKNEAWGYSTKDGTLVAFEECTLGKYKGKRVMSVFSELKK